MVRVNLIRLTKVPYHVTTRTYEQKFFSLPMSTVWEIALSALNEAMEKAPVNVIAFVLMGNHYHMILITPLGNLDKFMYEFNRRMALKLKKAGHHPMPVFQGRYKWSLIRSMAYFKNCYRYVYQNPLRAKIVDRVEEYPFSSLKYIVNGEKFSIPIHDKFGFKDRYNLIWLNDPMTNLEVTTLRKDLKKYLGPNLE